MRHMNVCVISILLVGALSVSGLFATAQNEKQNMIDWESVDMESLSFDDIVKTYDNAKTSYGKSYESLRKQLEKASEKNNAEEFLQVRNQLRDLKYPEITQAQDEVLVTKMMNAKDEEKKSISSWLYENDRYYHPTLYFTLESKGQGRSFSYRQSVSVMPGEKLTLPAMNVGTTQGVFVGWGLTPDVLSYHSGDEIEMPYVDQTLYAIFQNGVKFTDSVTKTDVFSEGSEAGVPVLNAPDGSFIFDGWYDSYGKKLEGDKVSVGVNSAATYTAFWKSLKIDGVETQYYKDLTIPKDQQVSLRFNLENQGNEALRDMKVVLTSDDSSLKVLNGTLATNRIMPDETKSGTFVILASGSASGSVIKATITATDGQGDTWSVPISLTIK